MTSGELSTLLVSCGDGVGEAVRQGNRPRRVDWGQLSAEAVSRRC